MKSLILLLALPLAMTACATRPATADIATPSYWFQSNNFYKWE